ncbi:GGDEF domain-containing protein [Paucibacter sp. APW11]|uniref:GGDEF domain-containing protein n=1 Tax=Roseateles aquae TaxID=3077235 RepID=A0ABU3PE26_9BURK|nr:GGDEF domain-containing protein [Paucibacter sp. APW11]MDT9000857.1 GGDEF domain-containing protein [Paucibacter sp. APW11]
MQPTPLATSPMPDSEMLRLRQEFVDASWWLTLVYALISSALLPARAWLLGSWRLSDSIIFLFIAGYLLAFGQRRRLGGWWRDSPPVLVMMLGGSTGLLGNGLLGSGLMTLIFANTLVAVLFGRRVVWIAFLYTMGVVLLAAWLYASGRLPPRVSSDYSSSPLAWLMAISSGTLMSFLVLHFVSLYRQRVEALHERLRVQSEEIARLAHHDELTGLPSLRLARDRLRMACHQAERQRSKAALLFIDLDGFKRINDSAGHEAGDEVLRVVAARMVEAVRSVDTVARLGGDEFIVILSGVPDARTATEVAQKIVAAAAAPIPWQGCTLQIGASIGIALYPEHSDTPEDLLRRADSAMYSVKRGGKNGYALHEEPRTPGHTCQPC